MKPQDVELYTCSFVPYVILQSRGVREFGERRSLVVDVSPEQDVLVVAYEAVQNAVHAEGYHIAVSVELSAQTTADGRMQTIVEFRPIALE